MNTSNRSCTVLSAGTDPVLVLEAFLLIALALVSAFANSVFISLLGQSTGQTGPDVRSLLLNSSIAYLIRSIYLLFRGVYFLILLKYGFYKLAFSPLLCWLIEFPYGVSAVTTVLCMLAIGVNRFYVTRRPNRRLTYSSSSDQHRPGGVRRESIPADQNNRLADMRTSTLTDRRNHYIQETTSPVQNNRSGEIRMAPSPPDKNNRSAKTRRVSISPDLNRSGGALASIGEANAKTKLIIVLIWMTAVVYFLALLIGTNENGKPACFCYYPLILQPTFSYVGNGFFLMLEVAILITYSIVFVRNRNMLLRFTLRTRQYNLRQRFHAWSNVRTTRMLLPAAIVHVSLVLVITSSLSPIRMAVDRSTDYGIMKLVMLVQLIICLDTMAFPLLCIRFNEHLRTAAKTSAENAISRCSPCCNAIDRAEWDNARKVSIESVRPSVLDNIRKGRRERSKSSIRVCQQLPEGKRTIIDYRLAPEVHEHIVQRTWEMKRLI